MDSIWFLVLQDARDAFVFRGFFRCYATAGSRTWTMVSLRCCCTMGPSICLDYSWRPNRLFHIFMCFTSIPHWPSLIPNWGCVSGGTGPRLASPRSSGRHCVRETRGLETGPGSRRGWVEDASLRRRPAPALFQTILQTRAHWWGHAQGWAFIMGNIKENEWNLLWNSIILIVGIMIWNDCFGFVAYLFWGVVCVSRYIVATHLEPTMARAVFPCFDEPDMKAVFNVTIIHRRDTVALANGQRKGKREKLSLAAL